MTLHGRRPCGRERRRRTQRLVALARLLADELPEGGARDLLSFARLAGQDLHGTALALYRQSIFGRATVVPTLLKATSDGKLRLTVNIRSTRPSRGA